MGELQRHRRAYAVFMNLLKGFIKYKFNYQPISGNTDIMEYGEKITDVYRTFIDKAVYLGKIRVGDRVYLEDGEILESELENLVISDNEFCEKANYEVKVVLPQNFKKYITRDCFADGTLEELERFLQNNSVFMLKPYDGLGGHGVTKMSREQVVNVEEFYETLKKEHLFLEGFALKLPAGKSFPCTLIRNSIYMLLQMGVKGNHSPCRVWDSVPRKRR